MTEYEHKVIGVFDPDNETPAFAYTMGLREAKGWPELLIIGLNPHQACHVLNWYSEQDEQPVGTVGMGGTYKPIALVVTNTERAFEQYVCQLEPGTPVTQIVVPDTHGRFPWDEGCEEPYRSFEVLGLP